MARDKKKTSEQAFKDALWMISPGSKVREALSAILQSRMGALICFGPTRRLSEKSEGGVKLDAPCTPQRIYELSKMDGAIILNKDGSRILYANRFLKPNDSIPSDETGTRHRAAERIARELKCVVIAVSERRSSVTLYVHDKKHVMDAIPTLVNKAAQAMQTLEKYIIVLKDALQELCVREFQDMVTIFDVCKAVQRSEMVKRIAKEIEPYILELGTEGRLLELQLQELVQPLEEADLVVRDFYREKSGVSPESIILKIGEIPQPDLLSMGSISQALGYGSNPRTVDTYLTSRGYRVLTSTHRLPTQIIENLVTQFGTLQSISKAPKDELVSVEGVGEVLAERVRVSLNLLRNQLTLDRR